MSHLMAPATGRLIPGEQEAATVAVSLEQSDRSSPPRGTNPASQTARLLKVKTKTNSTAFLSGLH